MAQSRVLYFITELNVGGAERALARLLVGLDRGRFTPSVACLYGSDSTVADQIRALDVPVVDLGMSHKWRFDALGRLYLLLRDERPAILHTWLFHANIPGRMVGRLAQVPIIINSERTMGMESRLRYRLNRMTHSLVDRVVCVSPKVADFVVGQVGIPRHKVVVIPNGVDLADFAYLPDKLAARAALGLSACRSADRLVLGTVARLQPVKRLDVLLRALVWLGSAHTVIVGYGPEERRLKALAEELGLQERVHFVGPQRDVVPWLAAMDVFVLSSDWEGMPNAVLEAMACGLPVVATSVGGTPDVVVDGGTGLLVPPRDSLALADALRALAADADRRRGMGIAGRQRVVLCFSAERMVARTEALYEELLGAKGLG
jgi:glycosyltransferase involved in cell wall biosynthesis